MAQGRAPLILYITLSPDLATKMGTCQRCVVQERGRPARAWDAAGDRELDFARERLLAELANFGVFLTERQAYVCP